jgi:hypothetical protein
MKMRSQENTNINSCENCSDDASCQHDLEMESLVGGAKTHGIHGSRSRESAKTRPRAGNFLRMSIAIVFSLIGAIYLSQRSTADRVQVRAKTPLDGHSIEPTTSEQPAKATPPASNINIDKHLPYQCPVAVEKISAERTVDSVRPKKHNEWYSSVSMHVDVDQFLQSFRNLEFDNWGHSYEEIKKSMYAWKSHRFGAELKDGDSIYSQPNNIRE